MVSRLDSEGFLQALWTFLGLQQQGLQLLQIREERINRLEHKHLVTIFYSRASRSVRLCVGTGLL